MQNFYDILGVEPNADAATIKAAWRQAARTLHPDQGSDGEKLKSINAAYDVLKDPKKRAAYDAQHTKSHRSFSEDFHNTFGFGSTGTVYDDLFRDIFGAAQQAARRSNAVITMPVSLKMACMGGEKNLKVKRQDGSTQEIRIAIQPGIQHGSLLRLPRENIIIRVNILDDETFTVHGNHLHMTAQLSMVTAALGGKLPLKDIYDTTHTLTIPPGTQTGTQFRIAKAGMPSAYGPGDLFVTLFVRTPTNLNAQEKAALRKLDEGESINTDTFMGNLKRMFGFSDT